MNEVVISGSGIFTPTDSISNEELVASFNLYVEQFNREHAEEIASGEIAPLEETSADFIVKVSGIKSRFVMNKPGILDPAIMSPCIKEYTDEGISCQAKMGEHAARMALKQAGKTPEQVDAVLVACTQVQRPYPAIAIEIQHLLGARGFAFDMQAACSAMSFGIQTASDAIYRGHANCVLVISPEICTARIRFRDRGSHFLFGDAAAAIVIEKGASCQSRYAFEILGTKLYTQFSNAIRSNFGFFVQQISTWIPDSPDRFFSQNGKKVFKDIIPLASQFIKEHLSELEIEISDLKRLWLHQANGRINRLISKKVFGREATGKESPIILDKYANTSSAGAIIAFHKYNDDLRIGDIGVICSFGAGYSIGSVVLRKST
ncbi:MAG: beta-ketoacyl-ACP synthase III [Anaerolineae bacterium]